ncbi:MAG: aldolase/citrate lyase family protein [Roseovarius sp.]
MSAATPCEASIRARFAARLRAADPLVGPFVKSRDPAVIEILAQTGADFAVLDAEHVAFDRRDIADMAMASRASGLPLVVRVPTAESHWLATAVDCGAAGVMVPQVTGPEMAARLVRALRHGAGGLGISPSTPGAEYGARGLAGHMERHPRECVLICQIEDPDAVALAEEIAACEGVDALLAGPADLTVAAGLTDPAAPEVQRLCEEVIAAGRRVGKAAGLALGDAKAAARWRGAGGTLFVLGTDQAFLKQAAAASIAAFREATGA